MRAIGQVSFGIRVCIGCVALIAASAIAQSEEVTVRSGSKTITIGSAKTVPASRSLTPRQFALEMLNAHNKIRAKATMPPFQWSGKLAAYAQKWANSMIANNRTAHSPGSPYGENILVTGLGSTPSSVVAEWASESQDYTYSTNACRGDCGHYTQIVWRMTREVGCAMARNDQREIWVCSYDPPGNYRGDRPY